MAIEKERLLPYDKNFTTGSAESILASLYRAILHETKITPIAFEELLRLYVLKTCQPTNSKDESSHKGTLRNELLSSAMTWNVFLKGLTVLNITRFEFIVTLYHREREPTTHSIYVQVKEKIRDKKEKKQPDLSELALSSLFQNVLYQTGVNQNKFDLLLREYIIRNHKVVDAKDESSQRGNFKKELLREKMSWNVFIKGMMLLKIQQLEVKVFLTHTNKLITEHHRMVQLEYYVD